MSKVVLLSDLASLGLKQVPPKFIRALADRPNLSDVQEISDGSIPLIDLTLLHGPHRPLVVSQIGQACKSHGFFQVLEADFCLLFAKMNDLMTKSFTSYVDLKKEAMKDLEAGPDPDVQMTNTMDRNLGLFLEEAERVKKEMGTIREILDRLQGSNDESKSLHKPEALKALRKKINADILTVLKMAKTIRSQLEEMDRANAANRRLSGFKEGTPIYRTRLAVTNGLRKKLKELMMDFQALRQRMMTEYKETVGRRYYTVTGENPDEEIIDKIISDSSGGEEFFKRAIQEHGRGKVFETVVEIQDRHDTAKEIEKSLLELHQVFLDMAVMVEAQGEHLDDIEHHVLNAGQYVQDGTKQLHTAKNYQRSSRKCMCIGVILLLLIVLLIVIPVATSFSHS